MKVLIAEDNADDRRMLRMNLEHHGCMVLDAGDGVEALRLAKEQKPDLIISDALMPKMDGFQFLRAVKTDEGLAYIPFIFYSAVYTGYQEAELAISLGAEAFIIKPKEPDELWSEIKDLLDNCKLKEGNSLTARAMEDDEFLTEYSRVVAMRLEKKVKELEKAKAIIEAKEQEWQTTFDAIGDCVTIHDMDYKVVLANKACEKFFGLSKEEIYSKKCFELFHETTRPIEECPRARAELSKLPAEAEFFVHHLNKWMSVSCFPLLDSSNALRGVVHFARDISERKIMEEALKASEEKYRALVEHSLVGVYQSTVDGRFIYVNNAMVRILEFENPEEMLTKNIISMFKNQEDRKHMLEELNLNGKIEGYEIEAMSKKGNIKTVKINSTVREHLISGVAIDITEQKKLEEQLRQAQKMEAVGQLTGGIAHDFNNILSAIVGYGGLLQMKMKEDDPLRPDVDHILAASERAAALTQSLLAFSRKQVVKLVSIDLNELIAHFQKFVVRILREDIELKIIMKEGALPVMADRSQIEQVLMNLAANARDAMPGGGRIKIETGVVELNEEFLETHGYGKTGKYALITISDTGKGMDSKTREKIFEPFFTTKEVGKGTGLGLSMAYGIVKQHNGFIHVYSEPGHGTTFRIYLPIAKMSATAEERAVPEPPAVRGGKEIVLIAEDDSALRKLTSTVLRHYGYTVIESVDGEDAITKFKENKDRIQLVILDGIMPKKNGKEAYDEIQLIKPGIRTIFMSGYSEEIFSAKSITDQGLTYILKPVTPSDLVRKVREVLDRGSE